MNFYILIGVSKTGFLNLKNWFSNYTYLSKKAVFKNRQTVVQTDDDLKTGSTLS